jgi:hypothetical protein
VLSFNNIYQYIVHPISFFVSLLPSYFLSYFQNHLLIASLFLSPLFPSLISFSSNTFPRALSDEETTLPVHLMANCLFLLPPLLKARLCTVFFSFLLV